MATWRSGPLGSRDFRLLLIGQCTSTIGDYCYAVGLPWFILSLRGGAPLLGAVLACYGIPRIALIPVGGILADKIGPRRVMLAADTTRCAFVAVLAIFVGAHVTSLLTLGAVAAVIGAGQGLFIPSSYTIMPSLVDTRLLASANALSMATIQAGSMLGPALGGALVAARGPVWAFAADSLSFALSALTLALIGRDRTAGKRRDDAANPRATRATRAGAPLPAVAPGVLALLRESRGLQLVMVVVIAGNLAMGGLDDVALPSLAHARYGAVAYGVLLACVAAGSVLGTLAGARSGGLRRPIIFSSQIVLIEATAMAVAPFAGGVVGMAVALSVLGACNGLSNVIFRTVLQNWAPKQMLGRVMSLVMLCAYGSFPLSVAATGIYVHRLGPVSFFPLAGGLVGSAMLIGLAQRQFRVFGSPAAQPRESAGQTH